MTELKPMQDVVDGEAVRLVIWDLDESFWHGTLTEGGIRYVEAHAEVVRVLARRGIVSSIASKNDFSVVDVLLRQHGIRDYFVFPAVNWQPKGPQIKRLIEAIGLRAETVLLIDDNASNRAEALHHLPGIRAVDETFIGQILSHPLLAGSDDAGLTRLAQYRLLERKRAEWQSADDNLSFLRASDIRVRIDFDIEAHLDRAIELINRTNQLNFTKNRLPEEPEQARGLFREFLASRNVQAGVIHVRDRFGDYGVVGFYAKYVHSDELLHFCFSCRTIGMGVEAWIYARLGRPRLNVKGEVSCDVTSPSIDPEWISFDAEERDERLSSVDGRILLRGGCEIQSIAHFARLEHEVVEEFAFGRDDRPITINHSCFLEGAFRGLSAEQRHSAHALGLHDEDFHSALASTPNAFRAVIASFWADAHAAVYRDRSSGLVVPFQLAGIDNGVDIRTRQSELEVAYAGNAVVFSGLRAIQTRFDYLGWSLAGTASIFERSLARAFAAVGEATRFYVLLAWCPVEDDGRYAHLRRLNECTRSVAEHFANVVLIDPVDHIREETDWIDATHFQRLVYFRIYQAIGADLARHPIG